MAAGPWVITNAYKTRLLTGGLDFDASNALRCILLSSSSNIASGPADCYTGGTGTAVTGELSTANGYTAGGYTLQGAVSGTSTVSADTQDATWTASGGTLTARYAAIYDNTSASKTIIAYCLLDSAPADVSVTTGNTLTIGITNVFQVTSS